ncbi:hypothetical protein J0383_18800 [Flavobacterium endoglycinae]|uniref:Uncharacterized protein n=1 Tax=Flavobacterium endoglycinae TaxID=2816357 RepID=A0ABX7QD11_9FLAO|nr:hypothetical protein [Flavobacterium endoglycinae]QSW88299.1 hypothetical protein J0383_18800 [Flavobacterium endoglycinae]
MDYPKYELSASTDNLVFKFVSNGTNGDIPKAIVYKITDNENIYNLGFGDVISIDPITGELNLDDLVESKNGDMEKIIATVAHSAYIFSKKYPDRLIFFRGSTPVRTRLYRSAISREFEELSKTFEIYGAEIKNGEVINVSFNNNKNFFGFYIKRK